MLKLMTLAAMEVALVECGGPSAELQLPYEKYSLDNGLQVVLRQDKNTPTVAVAIQYHVGSSRETPGATGFAHLFEHLLFQRSENLPRNAFFTKIDELGGTFNGSTNQDGTNYYEAVPRDALEKILWMESDRMGFFINTVTEDGLRREIDIVSNEKRQGVDNQPYGHQYPIMLKYTYPENHPYHWPVIGSLNDLAASTLDYVKEFYHTYYGPNNATLVISGDFNTAETKALVEKYFGEIPAGPEVGKRSAMPVEFASTRGVYYSEPKVTMPALTMVLPTVERTHPDEAPLDILTHLLAGTKKSPMHRIIVEEKKLAPSVSMSNPAQELAGSIQISVRAFEGVNLNSVMEAINEAYARFEAEPINEQDIRNYVTGYERDVYNMLANNLNVAILMARSNVFEGKPDYMIDGLNAYRAVTKDDIMRVYNKYVKGRNYLTVSYLPSGQEHLAVSGSTLATVELEDVATQTMNAQAGTITDSDNYERTPSAFDRSTEPALLANTPVLPELAVATSKLPNGLNVNSINYTALPLVSFSITIKGGLLLDDIDKAGVARLNAMLMNEGTALRTPEQLEEDIDALGASVNVSASIESTVISGSALLRNFPEVLKIVGEMLTQPRFDEDKFAIHKERVLANIQQGEMQPSAVAQSVAARLVYGKESILGYYVFQGTAESVAAITLDDIKAYYAKAISPVDASFNFVGSMSVGQVTKLLAPLAETWTGSAVTIPAVDNTQKEYQSRLFFVDFPDAPQSSIYIQKTAVPRASADSYPLEIANHNLGAGTAGELFQVLRLQHGYTYGAGSYLNSMNRFHGFVAYSDVQSSVTRHSLELFRDIITSYPDSILNEAKVEQTRNTLLQRNTRAYESPDQLRSVLQNIAMYGLPLDYVKRNENTLRNITLQEIRDVYHKWIDENDLIYVVTGDAARNMSGLESLGLGTPILVDRQGNIIDK